MGVSRVQGVRQRAESGGGPPDTHLLLHLPVMVRYLLLHLSACSWRAQPLAWDSRCSCGSVSMSGEKGRAGF